MNNSSFQVAAAPKLALHTALAVLVMLLGACGGGTGGATSAPTITTTTPPPTTTTTTTSNGGASTLSYDGPSLSTPLPLQKMVIDGNRTFALKADGTLYAWGVSEGSQGAFGDGNAVGTGAFNSVQKLLSPTRATALESATSPVVDVAIGFKASFALRADGSLWAVGSNAYGELARSGSTLIAASPAVRITGTYAKVVAGLYRGYAVGVNKALYWWGYLLPVGTQVLIGANVENVWNGPSGVDPLDSRALLFGGYALLTDGTVMAWGDNSRGAFGNGTTTRSTSPVAMSLPRIGVKDIVPGAAVMADGSLYLWGATPAGTARYYKDPNTGARTAIGLTPVKVASGHAAVNLLADGRVVRLDVTTDTDGALVLTQQVEASQVARHYKAAASLCNTVADCTGSGLSQEVSIVVDTAGAVRIKNRGSGQSNVATGGVINADSQDYVSSVFNTAFAAPPPPPAGTGGGTGTGTGDADALNFTLVNHTFTCAATQETKTVRVSNGPCLVSQQSYAKATSCNETGADFSFNAVGRPFYQCLVNNSSGGFKSNYQQYLKYYGG